MSVKLVEPEVSLDMMERARAFHDAAYRAVQNYVVSTPLGRATQKGALLALQRGMRSVTSAKIKVQIRDSSPKKDLTRFVLAFEGLDEEGEKLLAALAILTSGFSGAPN